MDARLNDFFKRHDGRRLDVRDNEPIERGMATEDLRNELARYRHLLLTGVRANGAALTPRERAEILEQSARLQSELTRRE